MNIDPEDDDEILVDRAHTAAIDPAELLDYTAQGPGVTSDERAVNIDPEDDDELLVDHPHTAAIDPAELLDETAQGHGVTSDESADGTGEIDAIGRAAGFVVADQKPFRGIEELERRDVHRWELDPASADE